MIEEACDLCGQALREYRIDYDDHSHDGELYCPRCEVFEGESWRLTLSGGRRLLCQRLGVMLAEDYESGSGVRLGKEARAFVRVMLDGLRGAGETGKR